MNKKIICIVLPIIMLLLLGSAVTVCVINFGTKTVKVSFVTQGGRLLSEQKLDAKMLENVEYSHLCPMGYKIVETESKGNKIIAKVDFLAYKMPIINIETENNAPIVDKENYVSSTVSVTNCDAEYQKTEVLAGVRYRGNSTMQANKKAYRIKFDKREGMLGLNNGAECKSWVLLAETYDPSMQRNFAMFSFAKNLNIYSSDCTYVEMFLNGEYMGVYLLAEHMQIDKYRINIEEYDPETSDPVNTGYLIENEDYTYQSDECYFQCGPGGMGFEYSYWVMKSDTTTQDQIDYIFDYMVQVYDAIYGANEAKIRELIDVDSAVERIIIELFLNDTDANASYKVWKDKDGKLTFGAPWDADLAMGNIASMQGTAVYLNHLTEQLMMSNQWFYDILKERWLALYNQGKFTEWYQLIEATADKYVSEFARNDARWKVFGEKAVQQAVFLKTAWPNYTCQKEASEDLLDWLEYRIETLKSIHFR